MNEADSESLNNTSVEGVCGTMDQLEDQREEPVAVHSLILASGKKVNIELYYDKTNWSLHSKISPVTDLSQLNLTFEPSDWEECGRTKFTLRAKGRQLESVDFNRSSARFRMGAHLAWILGESTVKCEGRSRWEEEEVETVTIKLEMYSGSLREDMIKSSQKFGSRGIITDDGRVSIPAEIISLHSPFFEILLFGEFMERNMEWIEMGGMESDILRYLIRSCLLSPVSLRKEIRNFDFEKSVKIMRSFDRFEFADYFNFCLPGLVERCKSLKFGDKFKHRHLLQISELARTDNILADFFNRFYTVDCLDEFLNQNLNNMDPKAIRLLSARSARISKNCYYRPKISFICNTGDVIVVALLNDLHPVAVGDFVSRIERGMDGITLRKSCYDLTRNFCLAVRAAPLSDSPEPLLVSHNKVLRLNYLNNYKPNCLKFDDGNNKLGRVIGLILSGHLSKLTKSRVTAVSVM